jgi:hypothetical protein
MEKCRFYANISTFKKIFFEVPHLKEQNMFPTLTSSAAKD